MAIVRILDTPEGDFRFCSYGGHHTYHDKYTIHVCRRRTIQNKTHNICMKIWKKWRIIMHIKHFPNEMYLCYFIKYLHLSYIRVQHMSSFIQTECHLSIRELNMYEHDSLGNHVECFNEWGKRIHTRSFLFLYIAPGYLFYMNFSCANIHTWN